MIRRHLYAFTMIAALVAFITLMVVLAIISLAGCADDGTQSTSDDPSPTSSQSTDSEISIKKITGDSEPQSVSILCVDGSAFLYVWDTRPSIARFPEQDQICASDDADQTKDTPKTSDGGKG